MTTKQTSNQSRRDYMRRYASTPEMKEKKRLYYFKTREKWALYHKEWVMNNKVRVSKINRKSNAKYYKKNALMLRMRQKEYMNNIRRECIAHYSNNSNCCSCCGEQEFKFLSIDHIDGGGNKHRKTITKDGKGGNMAFWLKKNGFPQGFQILCHNCNMAKGFYGICPHKVKSLE